MKVLVTSPTFQATFPSGFDVMMNTGRTPLPEQELRELIVEHQPDAIVASVDPFTRNVLAAATRLKVISRTGVGLDSIDLVAAEEAGIAVLNTPEAPVPSVAEHTVGLILSCLHEIVTTDALLRRGEWNRLTGVLLAGKTVGIVGCGRIGSAVAELLVPFRCNLIGVDPAFSRHLRCRMVSLETLLGESDVVTLHVPLKEDTRHMIDDAAFARMKPSSVLVNTSRGAVVDETALIRALEGEAIAKAALDVFENEPYSGLLRAMTEKTVLTPHIASNAIETRREMERGAVANVVAFFA